MTVRCARRRAARGKLLTRVTARHRIASKSSVNTNQTTVQHPMNIRPLAATAAAIAAAYCSTLLCLRPGRRPAATTTASRRRLRLPRRSRRPGGPGGPGGGQNGGDRANSSVSA